MNIDPDKSPKDNLQALREQKRDLIAKVREVEKQRNELKIQRDEKNSKVKELFQQAKETRENRDSVNEEVKLQKALRDLRQEDIAIVVRELEKLEEEMKDIGINTGYKKNSKHSKIAKQIQTLEITYQTKGNLKPEEEKEFINKIERLTKEMEQLEVVEGKREEFKVINKKLRKLRGEALIHHKEVQVLAERSQNYHETMLGQLKDAKKIRSSADEDHKKILNLNEDIKKIRKNINAVAAESDKIRKQLGQETATERKKRKQDAAKAQEQELTDKAEEIFQRYKDGAKLGFEEFKILISRGYLKDGK
ncbi:MAG: hypothetical protein INQ03_05535 [Candidatus Heimdallarchaeota archaeon]|nr:hypothetical protein [Candidatus Heimdallarchaeota archaeon]